STHAASQALHPMQVVVSMYFDTGTACRIPVRVPHIEAEERVISSDCAVIVVSQALYLKPCLSSLVEPDQEGLVFRRPGVRVSGGGSQEIRQRPLVALGRREAP